MSFYNIVHGRPPPTTPRTEQSHILMSSIDNDPLTRSILIDSAARQRGFLPYDYRIANTFESIRRQRAKHKVTPKPSVICSPVFNRTSTHSDVFGNLTSSMSKLAEQRLILHEKSMRKKHHSTSVIDKKEKGLYNVSDANFAPDIPNSLEIMLKKTPRKSTMERHLLETIKRERLQQARYRLLPISRAQNA